MKGDGDRDGVGDVDATDKGTPGSTCTGTVTGACRILDLDFDGDYDAADATKFDALTQGIARHIGRTTTATNQPFAHQGLLFEPEVGSYQNRHRQYMPNNRRFAQRDPVAFRSKTFNVRLYYQDGMTLYGYVRGRPIVAYDAFGLACGSEDGGFWGQDWLVPDTPAGFASFSSCCRVHDSCYETCGIAKVQCDQSFAQCMFKKCRDTYPIALIGAGASRCLCDKIAIIYYNAVWHYGGTAYANAQQGCSP